MLSFGEQEKFLLVMAAVQADFPLHTLLVCISMSVEQKKLFTYRKAKGRVEFLPVVIFLLIPWFPIWLCKAWRGKPVINTPMFA